MSVDHPYDTPSVGSNGGFPSSTTAKEQAQQAAETAAGESKHVAGVARDEAKRVASEAQSQVSYLLSQATSQVEEQSRTQRDRIVETLRSFGDDLDEMAAQSPGGLAADLAREGATRARTFSSRLDGREPRDLLDEVRGFARRRPGTFLLGALAAGLVTGRLTRGAKDAGHSSGGNSSGGSSSGGNSSGGSNAGSTYGTSSGLSQSVGHGTAAGTPLAGTGVPETPPAYPDDVDPRSGSETGLPNPAGSGAGERTGSDTRPGGLS